MAADAPIRRNVVSPSNITPPIAAMTGTFSCTVAALVAVSPRDSTAANVFFCPADNKPRSRRQRCPRQP